MIPVGLRIHVDYVGNERVFYIAHCELIAP